MNWLIAVLILAFETQALAAELSPLQVEGDKLVADGRPVQLRGINWGWWHLSGTRYSEADMRHVAQWGANTVRLAFSYNDLETDDNPAVWKEDGFKDLDDVAVWAKRYGVYLILDMHVTPGGQSPQPYCAGGRNSLWTDATEQTRFVALWSEIARRFHDRPEVAAYELMNEPGSGQKTPDLLRAIDQRAITAIRAVDPGKIIVVGGDRGSGPGDLTDAMKFPDKNILYTAHWYLGAGGNADWLGEVRQHSDVAGTRDWFKIEKTLQVPPGADHASIVVRSTNNTGSAWFDDIEAMDATGKILQSCGFDHDPQGYHPEALPETMSYDPATGHDKPGSLKVHASTETNDWPGWAGDRFPIQPGQSFHVSTWAKLDQATGDTFLDVQFYRVDTQLDPDAFRKHIMPTVVFASKYHVPVWIGEFGCDASNPDLQPQWVSACISLFEENGLSWTYWSDRSTAAPQGMDLQPEHGDGSDYPVNEKLLAPLRAGWALNQAR
ncbi:MAG TPA: glycoside hydrolase family 5 protein [Candidatus Methylacidiphilales bacterium]|nr:glycoside hydrolase family 5 protein [Candidatus Methylacidiphilales bacterium]